MIERTKNWMTEGFPFINGSFFADDWHEFLDSGAPILSLNSALGWDGNLGELSKIRDFAGRGLHLLPLDLGFDVRVLKGITGLTYLYLGAGCKGLFDANVLPDLKELNNQATAKDLKTILQGAAVLEILTTTGGQLKNSFELKDLPNLRKLSLSRPTFTPDKFPPGLLLKSLEVYSWTKLDSLSCIIGYPLSELKLSSCLKILDYSGLENMCLLETLFLDDCAPIPSASIMLKLPMLRELTLQGTSFIDRDISCLLDTTLAKIKISESNYLPSAEQIEHEINGR